MISTEICTFKAAALDRCIVDGILFSALNSWIFAGPQPPQLGQVALFFMHPLVDELHSIENKRNRNQYEGVDTFLERSRTHSFFDSF